MLEHLVNQDVLLIGGGHSHSLLIRQWAMKPLPGVRLTLVSRDVLTPYSGMLPGLVAGHYSFDDVHIDLRYLCEWASVRFIEAELTGLNLETQSVELRDRPSIHYDILSLDTGSTPTLEVSGVEQYVTPVKPVHTFYERWQELELRVRHATSPIDLAVVGAGAGGFELLLAMRHALPVTACKVHWVLRGTTSINDRVANVGEKALQAAKRAGVIVHTGFDVSKASAGLLHASDGRQLDVDETIWCTAAGAPSWPKEAGLNTDKSGFIETHATLQSTSHPMVFASGDIGSLAENPNAKAGVFAVRQAPVLFHNIRAFCLKEPLKKFVPQKKFLSLMATGGKSAIASRGKFVVEGAWVWKWKHAIDSKFMDKFSALTPLSMKPDAEPAVASMPCSGCGSKVARGDLTAVLAKLNVPGNPSVVQGIEHADDIATFRVESGLVAQSVDHIRAIVDDPYLFGRIAALHAMSDVFTATDSVLTAQALVTLPYAAPNIVQRELTQLLRGCCDEFDRAGVALVGGHTTLGPESTLGFVINGQGTLSRHQVVVEPGDQLVLTQPLGVGILFRGQMLAKSRGLWMREARINMLQSNQIAAKILRKLDARAITDVTGFGLLNHADQLLEQSPEDVSTNSLSFSIDVGKVPALSGALELAGLGIESTLLAENIQSLPTIENFPELDAEYRNLLCDPQTGGGLLAVVSNESVSSVLQELRQAGYRSENIGYVTNESTHRITTATVW